MSEDAKAIVDAIGIASLALSLALIAIVVMLKIINAQLEKIADRLRK